MLSYYVGKVLRIQPDRGRVVAGMNADAAVAFKKFFVKKDLYKTSLRIPRSVTEPGVSFKKLISSSGEAKDRVLVP